jgi:NAD(P)-dependent dehydrogenase (short-subunit alcohol dehydrogenase family)
MNLELRGLTALITGASRGIGRAIAESLAAEGCNLVLASRSAQDLATARSEITAAHGVEIETIAIDLSEPASIDKLVEHSPNVDILVNNAGAIRRGELLDIDETRWRAMWETKVFAYINLTRHYYARMRERGNGVIVNIIGLAAEKLDDQYIAGSSGNAALVAFTRALGSRSIDFGVRVVGINPGWVETDRAVSSLRGRAQAELGDAERWRELIATTMPRGRLITPKEIGDVVAFAASARASGISGHILTVDAGMAARSYR